MGQVAESITQEALDEVSAHIGTHFVSFKISTHEDEFIDTVKNAIRSGDIIRTPITPDNLKQVFDKWMEMIGREILGISDESYPLLFFADIMHDGTKATHDNLSAELLHKNNAPVFSLHGKIYELCDEFKNDCLMWMLFSGSNLTASANDLEWNNKKWSIVNHFIPFTESEVNSPERFESDFMVQYLADKKLSKEAQLVLDEGRELWQKYFSKIDNYKIRDELKLNRPDVGWYQIRKALEMRNSNQDFTPVNFENFQSAYKKLSHKLHPKIFELGFLKS